MKPSRHIEESSRLRLERLWMATLVVCAVLYMGCMMLEMGPKAVLVPIQRPIELMGLISGTTLFVIGLAGALFFTRD